MEPVRWGLLSTARINDALLAGIAGTETAQVVAVAGRDGARAREYAAARGIPRVHAGYAALLADPEVEAVYVSLPNRPHVEWSVRALEAGKHVLCEKPLSAREAEVTRAFEVASACDRLLAEAFMYRHHPQTIELARLVAEGEIGELRTIRSHFSFLLADPADVRLSPELDGGALMDLGCYCVSASRLLAGEPETVAGVAVREAPGGVDVAFAGALGFPGGVSAALQASFRAAPGSGLEVSGTTGTLRVPDPWHVAAPGIELVPVDGAARAISVPAADAYRLEAEDFSRAIRGLAEPRLGRDDAVGQARALERLLDAAA